MPSSHVELYNSPKFCRAQRPVNLFFNLFHAIELKISKCILSDALKTMGFRPSRKVAIIIVVVRLQHVRCAE